ncbi:MAG: MFS transporter [Parachlamydiales bacterium]|nr:MFS transporter [Parachlamydiales bacterium]
MVKSPSSWVFFSLGFLVFIDSLGFAILFPMLNPLFLNASEAILSGNPSESVRHFYYGLTLAIFPLSAFFASPILGDLSDKKGRKKILLLCLVGTFFGYALSAIAVAIKSTALFLLSRIIAGLTAGSQPIAQAAIVDISQPEHKAHYLSRVILASSMGWLAGPLIGGYLSDASLVSWFSPAIALLCASLLAFINIPILMWTFKEPPLKLNNTPMLKWHRGVAELIMAFKLKKIRHASIGFSFMLIGWSFYFEFIALYLTNTYGLSSKDIGLFMMWISIGFTMTSLFILKSLLKKLSIENIIPAALGTGSIVFLLILSASSSEYVLWPIATCIGICVGIAFTAFLTIFSNLANDNEQGKIMGITASLGSITWAISALIGGLLTSINVTFPIWLGGIFFILGCLYCYSPSFRKN